MASKTPESLIAHIISTFQLIKPKQLFRAYLQCGSYSEIWLNPRCLVPHIISNGQALTIEVCQNSSIPEVEFERMQKHGITLVAYGEATYPGLLNEIGSPPFVLYCRGNIRLNTFPLAVIGSRKVSEYGSEVIENLISGLAGLPISIISGLALGADAEAHSAALRHGLHTVGILGSGVDDASIYPRSHINLAQKILDAGGALISEQPPGTLARPEFFPMRNRIIAGMSRAVLVIEAAAKSGTLITANAALESGRDVWAVPGSIFSALSISTNQLISKGASVAQSAESMIDAYPELQHAKPSSAQLLLQQIIDEE